MALVNLTLEELGAAAQACRLAAVQADQDAAGQTNPNIRAIFESSAKQYRELAATFDAVQRASAQSGESPTKGTSRRR